ELGPLEVDLVDEDGAAGQVDAQPVLLRPHREERGDQAGDQADQKPAEEVPLHGVHYHKMEKPRCASRHGAMSSIPHSAIRISDHCLAASASSAPSTWTTTLRLIRSLVSSERMTISPSPSLADTTVPTIPPLVSTF